MLVQTKISPETIKNITFHTQGGVVYSTLGNIIILQGFITLEDCKIATVKWLENNAGLQVEYSN